MESGTSLIFTVFLILDRFVIRIVYKKIYGSIIGIRDLIDAVVSRRLVTLCVAPGAAPGAGGRR